MDIPSVFPGKVTLFGTLQVSQTLVAAFGTTIAIIIFALIFRFVILKNLSLIHI